jgi:hypothetical protein
VEREPEPAYVADAASAAYAAIYALDADDPGNAAMVPAEVASAFALAEERIVILERVPVNVFLATTSMNIRGRTDVWDVLHAMASMVLMTVAEIPRANAMLQVAGESITEGCRILLDVRAGERPEWAVIFDVLAERGEAEAIRVRDAMFARSAVRPRPPRSRRG